MNKHNTGAFRWSASNSPSPGIILVITVAVLAGMWWGGKKFLLVPLDSSATPTSTATSAPCSDARVYRNLEEALAATQPCILDLSNQNLSELSPNIGHLVNLRELDVSNNAITTLPPQIGWLRQLEKLDVSYNQLAEVPEDIGWLRQLKLLDARNNQLTTLPPQIGWLEQLTVLRLDSNRISSIPNDINRLQKLDEYTLTGNPLAP